MRRTRQLKGVCKSTTPVTEEVTNEFCSRKEYDDGSKDDETPNESETVNNELECWDPDNKLIVQNVHNHIPEVSLIFTFLPFHQKKWSFPYTRTSTYNIVYSII